jgi:APA family basic amino acid/polyamine antiporter
MEYTLSSAAVARGFSSYLATLIGLKPTFFVVHAGRVNLDFLVAALSCVLAIGTKHSSRFNIIITAVNLIVIVFVICAGMPYAVGDNYSPFAPFGARGIFAAASVVFFSFIGFDTVATAAEEVISLITTWQAHK